MKMGMDVNIYVDGVVEPMSVRYFDDVDAEGTMVAKFIDPIVDAATNEEFGAPLHLDDQIIVKPWRIVALDFTVFEGWDLTDD